MIIGSLPILASLSVLPLPNPRDVPTVQDGSGDSDTSASQLIENKPEVNCETL
jgi:hypothetical protein